MLVVLVNMDLKSHPSYDFEVTRKLRRVMLECYALGPTRFAEALKITPHSRALGESRPDVGSSNMSSTLVQYCHC